MKVAGVRAARRGLANPNFTTEPRRGFMQQQWNRDE
jgi:hypothetical protein